MPLILWQESLYLYTRNHTIVRYSRKPIPILNWTCSYRHFWNRILRQNTKGLTSLILISENGHAYFPLFLVADFQGTGDLLLMCVQSAMKLFTTSIFRTLSKKSFHEISYISYTRVPDILCLLTVSGEGLGVGFAKRCRIILHLSSIYVVFLPHVLCSGSVQ